jgi:transposase
MRRAALVRLLPDEREDLLALVHGRTTPQRVAFRARIVLRAAEGIENRRIAEELGSSPATVALWRGRFLAERVPGIEQDAPRSGRPPKLSEALEERIVRTTVETRSPDGAAWTSRSLAAAVGVGRSTVLRVWRRHHLPERPAGARPPPTPGIGFVDKITDFVGLYLDPPERAMVFLVDERHPPPGQGPGRPGGRAAAAAPDRSAHFLRFLRAVDRESPKEFDLHLVVDQLWTSGSPTVQRWLARHPRVVLHYVPGGPAGPSLVDRWVDALASKRIGPGSFPSVVRLHRAIRAHAESGEDRRRPFQWTATSREIRRRSRRPTITSVINGPDVAMRRDASAPVGER